MTKDTQPSTKRSHPGNNPRKYSPRELARSANYLGTIAGERVRRCREYVTAYKLERGCSDCGYSKHPAALDLDHLPNTVKINTVATLCAYGNLFSVQEELKKCEVVCSNCHRIRTVIRRGPKKPKVLIPLPDPLPHICGERNHWSKLNNDKIKAIRYRYTGARGELGLLAREYGVTAANISAIVRRKTWQHII